MKKIMILIVLFLTLGGQAIANGFSELNIRTNSNVPLKIILDGQVISNFSPVANIEYIPYGNHTLQVFRILKSYTNNIEEQIFFGNIYIPNNTVTNAIIKHHKFLVEAQYALNSQPHHQGGNHHGAHHGNQGGSHGGNHHSQNGNHGGNNHHYNPNHWNNNQPPVTPVCGIVAQEYFPGTTQHYVPEPVVEVFPMSSQAFSQLKKSINSQWFSDGKMVIFKQAMSDGHFLTSNQVTDLIELFSFSGERLEVAKIAYHNTLDKENYFTVYDSLQWNSSIKNLSNYIASL